MDPSTMGSDIPTLDATATLSDGAFPLNGAAPISTNGSSTNGTAANVMLPNAQAMSAGKMFHGESSKLDNQLNAQTRLRCTTGKSDYGE
jgi:hypothetical protein